MATARATASASKLWQSSASDDVAWLTRPRSLRPRTKGTYTHPSPPFMPQASDDTPAQPCDRHPAVPDISLGAAVRGRPWSSVAAVRIGDSDALQCTERSRRHDHSETEPISALDPRVLAVSECRLTTVQRAATARPILGRGRTSDVYSVQFEPRRLFRSAARRPIKYRTNRLTVTTAEREELRWQRAKRRPTSPVGTATPGRAGS